MSEKSQPWRGYRRPDGTVVFERGAAIGKDQTVTAMYALYRVADGRLAHRMMGMCPDPPNTPADSRDDECEACQALVAAAAAFSHRGNAIVCVPNRPDGHDACIGVLPDVQNACCGHGDERCAYVQFESGARLEGRDALQFIAARGQR